MCACHECVCCVRVINAEAKKRRALQVEQVDDGELGRERSEGARTVVKAVSAEEAWEASLA